VVPSGCVVLDGASLTKVLQTYLKVHDQQSKKDEAKDSKDLTAEEKKALQKKKKADAMKKANEDAAPKLQQVAKATSRRVNKVDPDPNGEQLLQKPPLEEATKHIKPLLASAGKNLGMSAVCYALPVAHTNPLEVQLLAFEVYIRKRKMLLALYALKKAHALQPAHPQVHLNTLRFFYERMPPLPKIFLASDAA
jgi:hypothetical protein